MWKNICKKLNHLLENPIIKAAAYVIAIILLLMFYNFTNSDTTILGRFIAIIQNEAALSVFIAGLASLFVATMIHYMNVYLEESLKIDDNHHKIVNAYSGHERDVDVCKTVSSGLNNYHPEGIVMHLHRIQKQSKKELKNPNKDKFSKSSIRFKKDVDRFENSNVLDLPTLNIFTNVTGKNGISFSDRDEMYKLPNFISANGDKLILAHNSSKISNNRTIRLSGTAYEGNILKLTTQRSTYFHMLITNRCMDYQFSEKLTLRTLYEYGKKISTIEESRLGNQIGINGVLITKDGYLLIEKRDYKKTTWKNKFAQPISLAMKEDDLKSQNKVIGSGEDAAQEELNHIIKKTLENNYGLEMNVDYNALTNENFLGLARDLLEGGKPNLFFQVGLNITAQEFLNKLRLFAKNDEPGKAISSDKIASEYYLVPYDETQVGFNYTMKLDRRKIIRVPRKMYPRTTRREQYLDGAKFTIAKIFKPFYMRECSEALLVCMSYLEICENRIKEIQ